MKVILPLHYVKTMYMGVELKLALEGKLSFVASALLSPLPIFYETKRERERALDGLDVLRRR
jgi:hypothetical protein